MFSHHHLGFLSRMKSPTSPHLFEHLLIHFWSLCGSFWETGSTVVKKQRLKPLMGLGYGSFVTKTQKSAMLSMRPWPVTTAQIISGAFRHIKCTVFDLPHAVANLPESSGNLSYVAGDMFESIPSADAILLKHVLHNWSDEDCVKILKRCKEAIPSKDNGGKVIIIDMVIDAERDEHDITEVKLTFNIMMVALLSGRERSEKEWEQIFLQAGFSHHKITPMFGLRSLIEVYP